MRLLSVFTWSVAGPAIDKPTERSTCGGRSSAMKPVKTTLKDEYFTLRTERIKG